GAGIHAADADDALCLELLVEAALGSPVADGVGEVADDQASGPDLAVAGLGVLVVPAGVTDLWGGEHRDLTVEGGVGEGLLVAGHGGGEHCLAEGLAGRAHREAAVDRAVCENQCCWSVSLHIFSPSVFFPGQSPLR